MLGPHNLGLIEAERTTINAPPFKLVGLVAKVPFKILGLPLKLVRAILPSRSKGGD